jgi:hypothetical protein
VVERNLAKVDVEGSNPFSRSIYGACWFMRLDCGRFFFATSLAEKKEGSLVELRGRFGVLGGDFQLIQNLEP